MNIDDPAVINVLRRSMIARIATLSRTGRPSINPLYFVYLDDHLWLGTADWTLAARNVKANPRVSVLFEMEQGPASHQVLRISGRASVRVEHDRAAAIRSTINAAVAGDVVLIAGKGHEDYQLVAGERRAYSDLAQVRATLSARSAA